MKKNARDGERFADIVRGHQAPTFCTFLGNTKLDRLVRMNLEAIIRFEGGLGRALQSGEVKKLQGLTGFRVVVYQYDLPNLPDVLPMPAEYGDAKDIVPRKAYTPFAQRKAHEQRWFRRKFQLAVMQQQPAWIWFDPEVMLGAVLPNSFCQCPSCPQTAFGLGMHKNGKLVPDLLRLPQDVDFSYLSDMLDTLTEERSASLDARFGEILHYETIDKPISAIRIDPEEVYATEPEWEAPGTRPPQVHAFHHGPEWEPRLHDYREPASALEAFWPLLMMTHALRTDGSFVRSAIASNPQLAASRPGYHEFDSFEPDDLPDLEGGDE